MTLVFDNKLDAYMKEMNTMGVYLNPSNNKYIVYTGVGVIIPEYREGVMDEQFNCIVLTKSENSVS